MFANESINTSGTSWMSPSNMYWVPSGYVKIAIEKMAIEIMSFPMKSMVIFHSYVSLPEGICIANEIY